MCVCVCQYSGIAKAGLSHSYGKPTAFKDIGWGHLWHFIKWPGSQKKNYEKNLHQWGKMQIKIIWCKVDSLNPIPWNSKLLSSSAYFISHNPCAYIMASSNMLSWSSRPLLHMWNTRQWICSGGLAGLMYAKRLDISWCLDLPCNALNIGTASRLPGGPVHARIVWTIMKKDRRRMKG